MSLLLKSSLREICRKNRERAKQKDKKFALMILKKLGIIKKELDAAIGELEKKGYLHASISNGPTQSMTDLMNFQKRLCSIISNFEDQTGEDE